MPATIDSISGSTVTLTLKVELTGSLLEMEESIQQSLNEAGVLASGEALKRFDTDGAAQVIDGVNWTTKGQQPKAYQTPYGEVSVERHVYQRGGGGKTYCPLEQTGRIVVAGRPAPLDAEVCPAGVVEICPRQFVRSKA